MWEMIWEMNLSERKYLKRSIPSTGALGVKCLDLRAESLNSGWDHGYPSTVVTLRTGNVHRFDCVHGEDTPFSGRFMGT